MSNTKHPRGKSRLYGKHKRKNREWGQDSTWKPKERNAIPPAPRGERRSPRIRLK